MFTKKYQRLAKNFIKGLNDRRCELIERECFKKDLTDEEAEELRLLQNAVGGAVDLISACSFPAYEIPAYEKLAKSLKLPTYCPRCGQKQEPNEETPNVCKPDVQ